MDQWTYLAGVGSACQGAAESALVYASDNGDVQFPDFLPECIPVQAKQGCSLDLISPRRFKTDADQGALNLMQNPLVNAGCR